MAEVSLTLTIHKTQKRVLWAETDKEFVDFLFCLYSIPMGQVLNLLNDNVSFGCLRNPYRSVYFMQQDFLQCDKDDILKPKVHLSTIPSLLTIDYNSIVETTTIDLYRCKCRRYMDSVSGGLNCLFCHRSSDILVKQQVPNPNLTYVAVKGGGVKYVVADDLTVSPKSSFPFLTYLNMMHIVALNELEEKVVTVNAEKCKKLLRLALASNNKVLTKLFKEELGF